MLVVTLRGVLSVSKHNVLMAGQLPGTYHGERCELTVIFTEKIYLLSDI